MSLLDVRDIGELAGIYFPEIPDPEEPYLNPEEQLADFLRFLDMLCAAMFVIRRKGGASELGLRGCPLSEENLIKALEPHEPGEHLYRGAFWNIAEALSSRVAVTALADVPTPLSLLCEFAQPTVMELIAVVMALAPDIDRKYEQVFRVLQSDTPDSAKPTLGLVADFCSLLTPVSGVELALLMDEDSILNTFVLEKTGCDARLSRLSRPLSVKKRVLSLLLDGTQSMSELMAYADLYSASDEPEPVIINRDKIEDIARLLDAVSGVSDGFIIHLRGPGGTGKGFAVRQAANILGTDVLALDAELIAALPYDKMTEILSDAVLKTVLDRSFLYLKNFDFGREGWPKAKEIVKYIQTYISTLIVSSHREFAGELNPGSTLIPVAFDYPSSSGQLALWEYYSKGASLPLEKGAHWPDITARYCLSPAKIKATLETADLYSFTEGLDEIPVDRIMSTIRDQSKVDFGESAAQIKAPFTWDDLKLPAESMKQLKQACDRLLYRGVVNDTYGFGKKLPYGRGLSILLYGPPGTGKTMAAQVIANELGLDIYRIDLSQVESKYIGESEKNLSALFDAAKYSNAVLFFDEADALFTQRTEISSANDRYANTETAFLLQKVEEYSGITILATNNMQNFDKAFKRRITFIINIDMPDEKTRLMLWRSVFPKEAPLSAGIDFAKLAQRAELSGSSIKSAALNAAYSAAAGGSEITTELLRAAVVEEYKRSGRVIAEYELI